MAFEGQQPKYAGAGRFWRPKTEPRKRLFKKNRDSTESTEDMQAYNHFEELEKRSFEDSQPESSPEWTASPTFPAYQQPPLVDSNRHSKSSVGSNPNSQSSHALSMYSQSSNTSGSTTFAPTQSLAQRILNDERAKKTIEQLRRLEEQEERRIAMHSLTNPEESKLQRGSSEPQIREGSNGEVPVQKQMQASNRDSRAEDNRRISAPNSGLQARMAMAKELSSGSPPPQELSTRDSMHQSRHSRQNSLPALQELQDPSSLPRLPPTTAIVPIQRPFSARELDQASNYTRRQSLPSSIPPSLLIKLQPTPPPPPPPPPPPYPRPTELSGQSSPSLLQTATAQRQRLSRGDMKPRIVSTGSPSQVHDQQQRQQQQQQRAQQSQQPLAFKHTVTPPFPDTHFELSSSHSVIHRPKKPESPAAASASSYSSSPASPSSSPSSSPHRPPPPPPPPRRPQRQNSDLTAYNTLPNEPFQLSRPRSYDLARQGNSAPPPFPTSSPRDEGPPPQPRPQPPPPSPPQQGRTTTAIRERGLGLYYNDKPLPRPISIEPVIDPRTGRQWVETPPLSSS